MEGINNILFTIAVLITVGIWGIAVYIRSRYFLHMMQLEEYKNNNYIQWIKEFRSKVFTRKLMVSFGMISLIFAVFMVSSIYNKITYISIGFIVLWSIIMLTSLDLKKEEAKKKLVFTARAKRLFASLLIVNLLELLIIVTVYLLLIKWSYFYYPIILFTSTVIYFNIPYNMIIANTIVKPIEKRVNKYYYDMAYDKVRTFEDLEIVGITGSYGKTSTKFITASILDKNFRLLKTPESYNTPMGISKVINNTLNDDYEIFVVEMGARKTGEIEEVAKLANPKIGVITSIGPTHLETFKNIENIMKTKYELIEELPTDGIAIFNYDNQFVKKLADKTFKEKILYGMEDIENLDIYATDIEVIETGSIFTLNDKEGNSIRCKSKLLGKHNISNILAGAAVGKSLGLSLEQIAKGVETVEPVPHRLQLINPGTGVIVIDDAFNSNPVGARAALDVISQFKEGKKIIVTPGMVELGKDEEKENKEFGKNIAKTCDYAILVGERRTKPIYEGLLEEAYNKDKIIVVNSINEATQKLQQIVRPKDVVLFENDLPDTYNE